MSTLKQKVKIRPFKKSLSATAQAVNSWTGPRGGKAHRGIDVNLPVGKEIYAAGNGKIIKNGDNPGGWGYYLTIDHDDGIKTLYAHLSKKKKTSGSVNKGDLIGISGGEKGATGAGNSRGPHLHWEVLYNGKPLDKTSFETLYDNIEGKE